MYHSDNAKVYTTRGEYLSFSLIEDVELWLKGIDTGSPAATMKTIVKVRGTYVLNIGARI